MAGGPNNGATDLARRVGSGEKVDLVGAPGTGRTRELLATHSALKADGHDPILLRLSQTLDKVEHAVVTLGASLGPDCAFEVDDQLRRTPGQVRPALTLLERHLGGRPLLVDDADALEMTGAHDDLQWMFSEAGRDLAHFLAERANLRTTVRADPARACAPGAADEPLAGIDVAALTRHVAGDPLRLRLAVSRELLQLSETGEGLADAPWARWTEGALLEEAWHLADPEVQELMTLLAAHVRPLDRSVVQSLGVSDLAIRRATASRVVEAGGSQLWLGRLWLPWVGRVSELRDAHERLAREFEGRFEGADVGRHVAMLEAFRHYVAIDEDLSRARRFLRYGVASLLERAHELSAREHRWRPAAQLYREVLDLDDNLRRGAVDAQSIAPIGALPRAYATHYWHYNLYKQGKEAIETTEAGYAEALQGWPSNALFWSRLVVTKFVAEKWQDALASLATATHAVPSPRARSRRLVERTARKLLARSHAAPSLVLAALAVWGDHRPDDPVRGDETLRSIGDALTRGVATRVLPSRQPLVFHRSVQALFTQTDAGWSCSLEELGVLGVTGRATTALEALERAAAALREDTRRALTTASHKLSAHERERKRALLGRVDVVASGLVAGVERETWVLAKVERPAGREPLVRALDDTTLDASTVDVPEKRDDDDLWLVRVSADPTGAASQRIAAFEEALTGEATDAIWQRWAARWQHHA